jgi:hypothetical protein
MMRMLTIPSLAVLARLLACAVSAEEDDEWTNITVYRTTPINYTGLTNVCCAVHTVLVRDYSPSSLSARSHNCLAGASGVASRRRRWTRVMQMVTCTLGWHS